MGVFSGIVVYLIVFWTVLFTILPWGNRAHGEEGRGFAGSAPAQPRIKKKFLITGAISAIIWVIIYFMIDYNVFDLFDMGRLMAEEDFRR